jgi:hypothetical protein
MLFNDYKNHEPDLKLYKYYKLSKYVHEYKVICKIEHIKSMHIQQLRQRYVKCRM